VSRSYRRWRRHGPGPGPKNYLTVRFTELIPRLENPSASTPPSQADRPSSTSPPSRHRHFCNRSASDGDSLVMEHPPFIRITRLYNRAARLAKRLLAVSTPLRRTRHSSIEPPSHLRSRPLRLAIRHAEGLPAKLPKNSEPKATSPRSIRLRAIHLQHSSVERYASSSPAPTAKVTHPDAVQPFYDSSASNTSPACEISRTRPRLGDSSYDTCKIASTRQQVASLSGTRIC